MALREWMILPAEVVGDNGLRQEADCGYAAHENLRSGDPARNPRGLVCCERVGRMPRP
jgi:hypothetical protein